MYCAQVLVLISLRYFDSKVSLRLCTTRPFTATTAATSTAATTAASSSSSSSSLRVEATTTTMKVKFGESVSEVHLNQKLSSETAANAQEIAAVLTKQIVREAEQQAATPTSLSMLTLTDWAANAQWLRERLKLSDLHAEFTMYLAVFFVYSVPFLGAIVIFSPLSVPHFLYSRLGFSWQVSLVPVLLMFLIYGRTFRGRPMVTGARSWDSFRYNVSLWGRFERYFSAKLVAQGKLDAKATYMYGFHPHGNFRCIIRCKRVR